MPACVCDERHSSRARLTRLQLPHQQGSKRVIQLHICPLQTDAESGASVQGQSRTPQPLRTRALTACCCAGARPFPRLPFDVVAEGEFGRQLKDSHDRCHQVRCVAFWRQIKRCVYCPTASLTRKQPQHRMLRRDVQYTAVRQQVGACCVFVLSCSLNSLGRWGRLDAPSTFFHQSKAHPHPCRRQRRHQQEDHQVRAGPCAKLSCPQ
jgi:hypothetical protein